MPSHWADFTGWDGVPEHLRAGLERYIRHGAPVGSFLTAVLENDLRAAVMGADPESLAALREILLWLYNQAPGNSSGNKQIVAAWRAHRGLERRVDTDNGFA